MTTVGTATINLEAKTGSFETDFARAARAAKKHSQSISASAFAIGTAIGQFLHEGAEKAYEAIKRATEQAEQYGKAAEKIGVGVEAYSRLAFAAQQVGVSLEQLQTSAGKFIKFQASAAEGNKKAAETFGAFGIAIKDSGGHLRDTESELQDWARVFKTLPDGPEKTALAMRLFGKSGQEIIPLLNQGADGMRKFGQEAERTGNVISEKTAKESEELALKIKEVEASFHGAALRVVKELLPTLNDAADGFVKLSEKADMANNVASVIKLIGYEAGAAAVFIQSLITATISLYSYASGAAKLNPLVYAINSLAGGRGPMEDFNIASESGKDAQAQLDHAGRLARYGINGGPAAANDSERGGSSSGPTNGRGWAAEARTNAAAAKLFADEQEKVAKSSGHASRAISGASDAARRHAEVLSDLNKSLDDTRKAQEELHKQIEDMTAKVGGPLAELTLEYNRQKQALEKLAATAEQDTAPALKLLTEAYQKDAKALQDHRSPLQDLIRDQERELKLLGLTGSELQTATDLYGMSAKEVAEFGKRIADNNKELEKLHKQIAALDEARNEASNFFQDFAQNGLSALKRLGDYMEQMILKKLGDQFAESLFGSPGSSGGGFLSSLFGGSDQSTPTMSSFFGSANGNAFVNGSPVTAFANGGILDRPTFFGMAGGRVGVGGEAGTEAILPLKRGRDGKLGVASGGRGFTQNVTFNLGAPTDRKTQDQIAAKIAYEGSRAMQRNR